jgi:hypothetical protein
VGAEREALSGTDRQRALIGTPSIRSIVIDSAPYDSSTHDGHRAREHDEDDLRCARRSRPLSRASRSTAQPSSTARTSFRSSADDLAWRNTGASLFVANEPPPTGERSTAEHARSAGARVERSPLRTRIHRSRASDGRRR